MSVRSAMEFNIPLETTGELLLKFGLYLSALFQLFCIAAVVALPDTPTDPNVYGKGGEISEEEEWDEGSLNSVIPQRVGNHHHNHHHHYHHHRAKKQDKKKRR